MFSRKVRAVCRLEPPGESWEGLGPGPTPRPPPCQLLCPPEGQAACCPYPGHPLACPDSGEYHPLWARPSLGTERPAHATPSPSSGGCAGSDVGTPSLARQGLQTCPGAELEATPGCAEVEGRLRSSNRCLPSPSTSFMQVPGLGDGMDTGCQPLRPEPPLLPSPDTGPSHTVCPSSLPGRGSGGCGRVCKGLWAPCVHTYKVRGGRTLSHGSSPVSRSFTCLDPVLQGRGCRRDGRSCSSGLRQG